MEVCLWLLEKVALEELQDHARPILELGVNPILGLLILLLLKPLRFEMVFFLLVYADTGGW
jgi:hypothetical protein